MSGTVFITLTFHRGGGEFAKERGGSEGGEKKYAQCLGLKPGTYHTLPHACLIEFALLKRQSLYGHCVILNFIVLMFGKKVIFWCILHACGVLYIGIFISLVG